jgi:predicted aconitase with swiveling domain
MAYGGKAMEEIILKGRKLSGGKAEGKAVVSHEPFRFQGWVDQATGIVVEKNHELEGVNLTGTILVYPTGKGSTGSAFWIYGMARGKTAPKGIINVKADTVAVIGAIISNIPMIDQLDRDPTQVIKTGDYLELDGDRGIVKIKGGPG